MKNQNKITHIVPYNVYGFQFIKLLNHSLVIGNHSFVVYHFSGTPTYSIKDYPKSKYRIVSMKRNLLLNWLSLIKLFINSDIVIQHGLFDSRHIVSLNFVPFLSKKLYWVVWGGDLYYGYDSQERAVFKILSILRNRLLRRVSNIITGLESDFMMFCEKYNPKAKLYFVTYSYNLDFPDILNYLPRQETLRVMIGNNATKGNFHFEVFDKVFSALKDVNIDFRILLSLSYGDLEYGESVIKYAKNLFGEKIEILQKFLSYDDYNKILNTVDIAIMHHDMPEGMGVILQLLTYGKKIYIKSSNPLYLELQTKQIMVFDSLNSLEKIIEPLTKKELELNVTQIHFHYSIEAAINKWNKIFSLH